MSPRIAELQGFHAFIGAKLSRGTCDLSPEEALDEWRLEHPDPNEVEESVAAVRESLREKESGSTGRLASEYIAETRAQLEAIEAGHSYPVWSPEKAFSAAASLLEALEEDKGRP